MTTLVFEDVHGGQHHVVEVRRLLVAGFTGRNAAAVARHLDELEEEGVPRPASTPTLYRLDPALVKQTPAVVVSGPRTSGEVEPVVVVSGGRRLLTVGSDHTDRDLERQDISGAKAACSKVVGTSCVAMDSIHDDEWDLVELRSSVEGDVAYQAGTLAELLPLEELLSRLADAGSRSASPGPADGGLTLADGDVLFLGTVPTIGGIRPSRCFSASIQLPGKDGPALGLSYQTIDFSSALRSRLQKPELEFTPVDDLGWVAVPGTSGQWERILASDAATGTATRMLRFEPGADTSHLGVLRHDFWEEVYILSGELHDLTLDRAFTSGTYACRPPGMPHGPWRSEPGCVTFEVRYPAI